MKTLYAQRRENWLRSLTGLVGIALLLFFIPALAQEEEEESEDISEETQEADDEEDEAVEQADPAQQESLIVTGSRLERTTYSSISPLQIIDSEVSRESGLIDSAQVVQESTAASGEQIDLTYVGFVLDDGPGASTANLRGLGADRTLILINGRRVAPSGVEGSPSNPNLNLIVPQSLIQRNELLLDGASAVYGSDAVAGVVNFILRKDFDGFEIYSFMRMNQYSRIVDRSTTMTWGYNFDRGFIGVGASKSFSPQVRLDEAAFNPNCERHVERDQKGNIRHDDLIFPLVYKMNWDDCRIGLLTSRVSMGPPYFSIYATPGRTNIGIDDWSDSTFPVPGPDIVLDGDRDGKADFSFRDYSLNGRVGHTTLIPESNSFNVMAYGEYTFSGELNLTPFFEFQIGQFETWTNGGEPQLFPLVPANNPFNFCNPRAEGGQDCILTAINTAGSVIFRLPEVRRAFIDTYGPDFDPFPGGACDRLVQQFGWPSCAYWWLSPRGWSPGDAISMLPIVSVYGDRSITTTNVRQNRVVMGVTSGLPFLEAIGLGGWKGELSTVITSSLGESERTGVRADRLNYSLGWYNSRGIPCFADDTAPVAPETSFALTPDVTDGCVPVDMFASSLYPSGETVVGDFASAAERNYLIDGRNFDTEISQMLLNFYMQGALFSLPNGTVLGSYGFETRTDEIVSLPDDVARDGLFFGYFKDAGATGKRTLNEHFTEIEFPLFSGGFMRHELTVNLSGRITATEIFDTASTWSAKVGWRPNSDWFVRATTGTSYRTPNLRNLFLKGLTGFQGVFDPCLIPDEALSPNGTYEPDQDFREEYILDRCVASGVDPTRAHNYGQNAYSVEILQFGAEGKLNPESSTSKTFGVVWEQPFTNDFDLRFSWTYYALTVDDTIFQQSTGFVLYDCYYRREGDPTYCDRIHREDNPSTFNYDPLINLVELDFLNRDEEMTRGFDFNVRFGKQFEIFEKPVQVSVDMVAHRLLERSYVFFEESGEPLSDDLHADWRYHRWKHNISIGARMYDLRARWTTRIQSPQSTDPIYEDVWSDIYDGYSSTCLGPPDDVQCRDVGDTGRYFIHSFSFAYADERVYLGVGVYNVFDTPPPIVDGTEVFSINNYPIGAGYDLLGRSIYFNLSYSFTGN